MEQREKLIELLQSFENEYPKSFDSLYYELAAEADYLLKNGVVVLPTELKKAVFVLAHQYEQAKQNKYVRNPIAYSMYYAWKEVDSATRKGGDER